MISLPVGVRVVKFYDAEMKKAGKGILYLLSNGIMFEKKGEGAKFECNFEYLASFEAVKKDKLRVVIRAPQGPSPVEFKVDPAKQVEYDIAQVNKEYSSFDVSGSKNAEGQDEFDQNAHSRSEATWFQENWDDIMKYLKPERTSFLNEFVKNVKIGSPNADPYLLVVDHENLTYKDFADLPGFLKWRYKDVTEKEIQMLVDVFRDYDYFSVSTLEMQIQLATKSKNYIKHNQSLYERVALVSREVEEEIKNKK